MLMYQGIHAPFGTGRSTRTRTSSRCLRSERNRTPERFNLVEYKNAQGEWAAFTAAEFRAKVVALAKGLIARGVMPGESVSIIAHTCWQWTALDVAIMSIGALTVPVYETNSPAQVKMIFNDANVKMAFAEDDRAARQDRIRPRTSAPDLGDVYVIGLGAIDTIIEYGHARSPTPNSKSANKRSKAPTSPPSCTRPAPQAPRRALSSPMPISCSSPIPASAPCPTSP